MGRVIAGVARGRRLVMPAGTATRPTADRAREGLFSSLTSLLGGLDGLRFLDLFAGSGAVGLEAASRGASRVVLVERDPTAARAAQSNVDTLALPGVELWPESVDRALSRPKAALAFDPARGWDPTDGFDVVFLDPPYADPTEGVLGQLLAGQWLAPAAVVVVERASRGVGPVWPQGLALIRSRRYGEATLWYGRGP